MAVQLPPDWVITQTLEHVPDPNYPGLAAGSGFSRWTYICTNPGGYVCSSGSLEDCENQALSMAQCRTQEPYY